MDRKADWKRLQVGDVVHGYDGAVHGKFTGPIVKYQVMYPVRKNLPLIVVATVEVNEFGSTVNVAVDKLDEAYDATRPLVHDDIKSLPLWA